MRPPVPLWLLLLFLFLISFLTCSNFFVYHSPGAIGSSFQSFFEIDEEQLASLYTIYSAPNIVLVFIGGILIDKYGLIRTSLGFNLSIFIGTILFASTPRPRGGGGGDGGGDSSNTTTMTVLLLGRLLIGVGGECICVCATAMIARWWKKSHLTFAIGFHSAFVQLIGSASTFVLLPYLLGDAGMNRHTPNSPDDDGGGGTGTGTDGGGGGTIVDDSTSTIGNVRLCLWVGVIVAGISLLANLAYGLLEVRYGMIYVASELEEEFSREMDAEMFRLEIQSSSSTAVASSSNQSTNKNDQPSSSSSSSQSSTRSRSTKEGKYSIVQSNDVTPIHVRETNSNVIEDSPMTSPSSSNDLKRVPSPDEHHQHQQHQHHHDRVNLDGDDSPITPTMTPPPTSPNDDVAMNGQSNVGDVEHSSLLSGLSNLRSIWEHTLSEGSSHTVSLMKPWIALKSMPTLFWMVVTMQGLLSPILYSFSAFGPQMMMEKYGLTQEEAGFLTSILYIAIILAPLFGYVIDKVGYRCIIQTVVGIFIPIMFIILHTTDVTPYLTMAGLGLAFAVTESNGLAMIADVSPPELLGTAYGILGCIVSFSLLFEPFIVGYLHIHTRHYYWSNLLFILVSSLGWLATFVVYVYDVNHSNLMSEGSWKKMIDHDETHLELSEQSQPYPELEIVFDHDPEEEEDEESVQLFTLDDQEIEQALQLDMLP